MAGVVKSRSFERWVLHFSQQPRKLPSRPSMVEYNGFLLKRCWLLPFRLCWPHLWRHLRSYKVSSSCNPFDFLRHPLVCLWGFLLVYGIFLPCPVMLGAHDADYLIAGLRSNILSLHYEDRATPKQRTYVSAVSGGIAGGTVTRLMGTWILETVWDVWNWQ